MVSSTQLADKTSDDECQARTANRHRLHLQALPVNRIYKKRLHGVNEESPLLELPYLDVTRQLPPDIMPDISEGTAQCVLREVLKGLFSSVVISKKDLDDISLFEFGPNGTKNKPAQINMSFVMKKANLRGDSIGQIVFAEIHTAHTRKESS
ncbi:hypothetical protein MTO96_042112 [Rhipicephalus appendiculatus]